MEFPERVSEKLTNIIADTLTDLTEEKLEQINYGIAIFIANLYKFVIIFVAAYLLRVFNYMLVALGSFAFLRLFAAGLHGKKEWTCLLSTISFIFGTVYLAKYINFNLYILTLIYLIGFLAMLKYAPSDTEERPIYSKSYRKTMRALSCAAVIILYVLALSCYGTTTSSIITISTVMETILILPVSYKVTGNVYGTGLYTNKEEV